MPVGAIIGGATSLIGGLMGSHAANKAADAQAQAAEKARALIEKNQNAAVDFSKGVWSGTQQNYQPYLDVGSKAAGQLSNFLDTPFKAPTIEDVRNTPGYQFQLEQGIGALDKSAAAKGNLFSGTQGTELEKFAGGLADTTYGEAYNRAMTEYMNRYGILSNTSNAGQQAAGAEGSLGLGTSNNISNTLMTGAQDQASQINNAAAARASGYVGSANAWGNAIPGIGAAGISAYNYYNPPPVTHPSTIPPPGY